MKKIISNHLVLLGRLLTDRHFLLRSLFCLILLLTSLGISYVSQSYTNNFSGYVVPDIILDHLPTIDTGIIFFQGAFVFIIILLAVHIIFFPRFAPFTLAASALFFFIRSVFMILTHLSAPATASYNYIEYEHHIRQVIFTLNSGNDLFFSGHVGFPFLIALIFWPYSCFRYFFMGCSFVAMIAVLLGHLHYSIDVFSAFFITYGVFEISKRVFRREYILTQSK